MNVKVGSPAPKVELEAYRRGELEPVTVALGGERERWVVLFFYPRDFTRVCPTEVVELSKRAREFSDLSATVIAVSTDDVDTHRRWIAEKLGPIAIPLAADPERENARRWDVLVAREGGAVAARATFVVDPAGAVRHAAFTDPKVGRSISEILRVLEALRSGEASPAEWRPGEPTLGG